MTKSSLIVVPLLFFALTSLASWAEETKPPSTRQDFELGHRAYQSACAQCHDTGVNGAPKLREKSAWKDRVFEWYPLMNQHATSGYLKMPAMGNHPLLSNEEVANAVFYMTETLKMHK